MTKEEIAALMRIGKFPENPVHKELVETHISWVILCDSRVYKIKKPIQYSFLDFSTIEKRKYYCHREIALNKRLTEDIYLQVLPITEKAGMPCVGEREGKVIDYAVEMRKMERNRQMDLLLKRDEVTRIDIVNLANKIAAFHKRETIIYHKDLLEIQEKFKDLDAEKEFLSGALKIDSCTLINHAIAISDAFLQSNKPLLADRQRAGFFRDCHGDLHSRNIFLLRDPQPFDCIEFNDDYRQIDVLNEIAFLCMDLDAFGRKDLADLFLDEYNRNFRTIDTAADRALFIYYKSYRANVRAKVNSLRARGEENDRGKYLTEAEKYLKLMDNYISMLSRAQP